MPTGYTAGVVYGKVADFPTFAMQCARAFGACIDLRDAPADAPIPSEFRPSPYYAEALAEAKAEMARIQKLSIEQAETEAAALWISAQAEYQTRLDAIEQENARIAVMIQKVNAWQPPTPEHVGLKNFMLEQLTISKSDYRPEPPKHERGPEWLSRRHKELFDSIARYAAEHAKEVERAAGRTAWIRALRASLVTDAGRAALSAQKDNE